MIYCQKFPSMATLTFNRQKREFQFFRSFFTASFFYFFLGLGEIAGRTCAPGECVASSLVFRFRRCFSPVFVLFLNGAQDIRHFRRDSHRHKTVEHWVLGMRHLTTEGNRTLIDVCGFRARSSVRVNRPQSDKLHLIRYPTGSASRAETWRA